ncbi:SDR family NAD(P)-dependent oxidoreductase, partial [Enterobacter sp. R1(2018)]|uniref:SDR family NAD(P)-dependent oxidoreductase n=1 Tax=Enterobacter sp. R1(2018) TaxID=2447891 RepID=UPI00217E3CC4
MNNLFTLENKRVLITGSAQGIGFLLARGLAEQGAEIIINDITPERAEHAAMKLRDDGYTAWTSAFNVTDPQAVEAAGENIERE